MSYKNQPSSRAPHPEEIRDILGFLPLVATYFAKARADMPAEHAESFAAHQLSSRHGAVCTQLVADEALSVGRLASRMGLAVSTVSELVGDLDRAGWVHRNPDPANRRRVLVSLTPRRRASMEEMVTRRAAPLLRAMDSLDETQREGFAAGLRAWAAQLRDWRGDVV